MEVIDGIHLDPPRSDAELLEEGAGDGRGIAEKRIEVRACVEGESAPTM
jgi:hypothetical protein